MEWFRPLAAAVMLTALSPAVYAESKPWQPPSYDKAFGQVWYDGKAELASYDLTYPRYGELRHGTAVAVTVTEPFDPTARVKADQVRDDTYNVVKLNVAEDFQTGVYDYNLMTSVFVAVSPANGLPAGSATKVSFSAQEWCGHAYTQALFSAAQGRTPGVRQASHSYFEGEADQSLTLDHPAGGLAEDALMLWARGLAGPTLEPGQSTTVPVYRSLAIQRLRHTTPEWETAKLMRSGGDPETIETAAGTYECDLYIAQIGLPELDLDKLPRGDKPNADRTYIFYIDTADGGDRRLIKMTRSDGYELVLAGVDRMPYWSQHDNADEKQLEKLNLHRRGPGTM